MGAFIHAMLSLRWAQGPDCSAPGFLERAEEQADRQLQGRPLGVDCLDAPHWTAAALVAANDDRTGLEALAGLWAALVKARPQATMFRLTVSFDLWVANS